MKTENNIVTDMELVHRQLYCVIHLCKVVETLSNAKIKMLPAMILDPDMGHHLIKMSGNWANWFMEEVGNMLNEIGANDENEDKRWDKTFKQASERWKNLTEELNADVKAKL